MKKGFTLIELIFLIVICGILASVALSRIEHAQQEEPKQEQLQEPANYKNGTSQDPRYW